jgi:hypothetical protein
MMYIYGPSQPYVLDVIVLCSLCFAGLVVKGGW